MKANAVLTYSTVNRVKGTKRLPNVNPNYVPSYENTGAESSTTLIKTAVQALNNLTTNSYSSLALETEIEIN